MKIEGLEYKSDYYIRLEDFGNTLVIIDNSETIK